MTQQLAFTLFAFAACLTLAAFSYYRHTKEHLNLKPRMVPWSVITMGCVATLFMLAVHIFNLLGYTTGANR